MKSLSLPGSDESLCNWGLIELVFSCLVGFDQMVLTWSFEFFGWFVYDLMVSYQIRRLFLSQRGLVHPSSELIASSFLPIQDDVCLT